MKKRLSGISVGISTVSAHVDVLCLGSAIYLLVSSLQPLRVRQEKFILPTCSCHGWSINFFSRKRNVLIYFLSVFFLSLTFNYLAMRCSHELNATQLEPLLPTAV